MDIIEINKVLSNQVRIDILKWLKKPEENFPAPLTFHDFGISVGLIHKKTGLSQSTVSEYLNMLLRTKLLICTRNGKWTYYKRNESEILKYLTTLSDEL
ncbi:ArsR/SmtB family transcription factor [Flavobacterium pectinovorum]|uniref:Transcriptional regulator n=1 Tax=Flavobacterium pectinovorum TaxID=29533 RepID=A0A502EI67_9FLAO|nr:helix-turn-helix transcriptional regulator [Flavobacterium pectinovorum]TPG36196.1 transcriptional regulator [Flavobacterium pectinovorum]